MSKILETPVVSDDELSTFYLTPTHPYLKAADACFLEKQAHSLILTIDEDVSDIYTVYHLHSPLLLSKPYTHNALYKQLSKKKLRRFSKEKHLMTALIARIANGILTYKGELPGGRLPSELLASINEDVHARLTLFPSHYCLMGRHTTYRDKAILIKMAAREASALAKMQSH